MKQVARNLTVQRRNALVTTNRGNECAVPVRNRTGRGHVAWFCLLLATLTAAPGCNVFYLAKRTLKHEPRDYDLTLDEAAACDQYAIWADEAWGLYLDAAPQVSISPDFEQGFRDGFVDFVFAGGTGEPPPVPPRRFWRTMYRNPHGDQTINDWSAGFRTGAAAARHGGYRARALVPALTKYPIADTALRPKQVPWQPDDTILNAPIHAQPIPAPQRPKAKSPRPEPLIEAPVETPLEKETPRSVPRDALSLPGPEESYIPSPTEVLQEIESPAPAPSLSDAAAQSKSPANDEPPPTTVDDQQPEITPPSRRIPAPDQTDQTFPDGTFPDHAIPGQPDQTLPNQTLPDQSIPDDALDLNPFDPLPGIDDPLELPDQHLELPDQQPDALPDQDRFEDLFGPNDAPESEAYRQQTTPSDRVIQHRNQSPSHDVKQQISTALSDGPQQTTRQPTTMAAKRPLKAPLAESIENHSAPQAAQIVPAGGATTTAGSSLADVKTPTKPLTREDWFIDGLSSDNNRNRDKTGGQQETNLPGLPEPTEVDRIADQLVGTLHRAEISSFARPHVSPTQSQTPSNYPAMVAPLVDAPPAKAPLAKAPLAKATGALPAAATTPTQADVAGTSATNMSPVVSQAIYDSPVVDSSDTKQALATNQTAVDQRSVRQLSLSFEQDEIGNELMDYEPTLGDSFSDPMAERVTLEFTLDHLDPSDDDIPAWSLPAASSAGALTSATPDGRHTGFREIEPTPSERPIKIRFPPKSEHTDGETLFDVMNRKPSTPTDTADKSTRRPNATRRVLEARRAFQGPVEVQAGYQRYSDLFQN